MKLIVAQGNPGKEYTRSRHNIGWQVIDAVAAAHQANWRSEAKFGSDSAEFSVDGEKVRLIKPLSFYNETGPIVRSLLDFYKLDPAVDLLVVHDELALPFGTIRSRQQGSDAGNNGIKSINQHVGPLYARLRIGIWNDRRDQMDDAAFVLQAFSATEAEAITQNLIPAATALIDQFIAGGLPSTSASHI